MPLVNANHSSCPKCGVAASGTSKTCSSCGATPPRRAPVARPRVEPEPSLLSAKLGLPTRKENRWSDEAG
ncbi:uncharacterized protein UV8b_07251 [Ustilaginoidea virens]|uniref:Zinc ribbon domain-containing protein n=1 Tax=Ustilaginoidea virens TaxID=1159556 RepID=A0A8E5HX43_USTVR|nr:uncharacterized protein UV8b_07251 [Ustilaginoidea virens]QUC23010.1 hypothetical protein UV8b_07251 [Ustilaginoidea virens]